MNRYAIVALLLLSSFLTGCATLSGGDDGPSVRVVGLDPLPSEELEVRFALKLRVQNPNESSLSYDGLSVKLNLDGKGLASGVSNETGQIARFSDTVITIPVSISAFSVVRQLLSLAKDSKNADKVLNKPISYSLTGKLGAPEGSFRAIRFSDKGELDLFSTESTDP